MRKLAALLILALSTQAYASSPGLQKINNAGQAPGVINFMGSNKWARLICPNKEMTAVLLADLVSDLGEDQKAELSSVQTTANSYQLTLTGGGIKVNLTVPFASGCSLVTAN